MRGMRNCRRIVLSDRLRPPAEKVLLSRIKFHAVGWWAARFFSERLAEPDVRHAQKWQLEEAAAIRALAAVLRELRQSGAIAGTGAGAPRATA